MSTDAESAQACFVENFKLFGAEPVDAPEKNLYKGLAFLARAIADLETKVEELESELDQIRHFQYYQTVT